jgi:hypothetical protein
MKREIDQPLLPFPWPLEPLLTFGAGAECELFRGAGGAEYCGELGAGGAEYCGARGAGCGRDSGRYSRGALYSRGSN